uniref:DUF7270 domain-containing protein n=1 Tax=Serratia phage Kevin TaxID=3161161 RepID=A0AAU8KX89_9CAUD
MVILPTEVGTEHILVLTAIQAIKDGEISAPYSGTIRKFEYAVTRAHFLRCVTAWLATAQASYPGDLGAGDEYSAEEVIHYMAINGFIAYDRTQEMYVLNGLWKPFPYYMTTEANIQDNGAIVWGRDGIGASYVAYNTPGVPFDGTVEEYLAQYPAHRVAGNDAVLIMPASQACPRLINGWNPSVRALVAEFRTNLPPL